MGDVIFDDGRFYYRLENRTVYQLVCSEETTVREVEVIGKRITKIKSGHFITGLFF